MVMTHFNMSSIYSHQVVFEFLRIHFTIYHHLSFSNQDKVVLSTQLQSYVRRPWESLASVI
jgi:hypothetical protein